MSTTNETDQMSTDEQPTTDESVTQIMSEHATDSAPQGGEIEESADEATEPAEAAAS